MRVVGPGKRPVGVGPLQRSLADHDANVDGGGNVADVALLKARIARAVEYRASLSLDATAYRVVHGEADLLPSLVVDRYGDYLVVQALSQGMDTLVPEITTALMETLAPAGILARHDPKVRLLEGWNSTSRSWPGPGPAAWTVRAGRWNTP